MAPTAAANDGPHTPSWPTYPEQGFDHHHLLLLLAVVGGVQDDDDKNREHTAQNSSSSSKYIKKKQKHTIIAITYSDGTVMHPSFLVYPILIS